ncbi:MAG: hypothetical protein Harvfovirus15_16 [Harvfovirus sp.]|uniref:Uncharacterized protein n=1 Tax=Harvfovirus sp. TaxID=2487768 RepID=A0A3G5A1K1_9VIRU|nr:MAG: hypothetical protein Harvfovirus15_16 [Harvfovirus sp.]
MHFKTIDGNLPALKKLTYFHFMMVFRFMADLM